MCNVKNFDLCGVVVALRTDVQRKEFRLCGVVVALRTGCATERLRGAVVAFRKYQAIARSIHAARPQFDISCPYLTS